MKIKILFFLILITGISIKNNLFAQDQTLHNTGLNLTGANSPIKSNGNAGTAGQFLQSQGTGNTPIWADVTATSTGQSGATVYSTSSLGLDSSIKTFALVPGLTKSITVPSNAIVLIATDGGAESIDTFNDYNSAEVALFIDGSIVPKSGSREIQAMSPYGPFGPSNTLYPVTNWSMSSVRVLNPGTHTIEVRAKYKNGSTYITWTPANGGLPNWGPGPVMYIGGPDGSRLQGELTVIILKQ